MQTLYTGTAFICLRFTKYITLIQVMVSCRSYTAISLTFRLFHNQVLVVCLITNSLVLFMCIILHVKDNRIAYIYLYTAIFILCRNVSVRCYRENKQLVLLIPWLSSIRLPCMRLTPKLVHARKCLWKTTSSLGKSPKIHLWWARLLWAVPLDLDRDFWSTLG